MSQGTAFFIMINNSIHDVAAAMLISSGLIMWTIRIRAVASGSLEAKAFMLGIYRRMSGVVFFSLFLISLGAIPRIISFKSVELSGAASGGNIAGLIVKHCLIFVAVVSGAWLWISIHRTLKRDIAEDPAPGPR